MENGRERLATLRHRQADVKDRWQTPNRAVTRPATFPGSIVVRLLSSARRRRRLLRLGIVAAFAVVVAGVVVLLPNYSGHTAQRFTSEPVQVVKTQRQVPVRPEDRRAIDALLDRFVPAAVDRRDPASAYSLATAALRAGTSRAAWANGDVPVFPLAVADSRFHDWSVEYSFRNEVNLELLVHGRKGSDLGGIAYSVDVKLVNGRWLVDSFVPRQEYAASAPAPATPVRRAAPVAAAPQGPHHSRLWFVVPIGVLLVPLLGLATLGVVRWRRNLAAERSYRTG